MLWEKQKIHMICNAHIDPIWQWDWPEGVSATLSTFYTAARLADEFDYIFCHNEVTVYKYIEQYAPELFEKINGNDAIIFILLNNAESTVESGITVNSEMLPLTFGKYEVKTVVYENGKLSESYELLV